MQSVAESLRLIKDAQSSLLDKYNAIFALKSQGSEEAALALCEASPSVADSELLQHEVLYAIGQMGVDATLDFVTSVLEDPACSEVVRHEAGEALANFPHLKERVVPVLERHVSSPSALVAATARLALEKLRAYRPGDNNYNRYLKGTLEPAEPFTPAEYERFLQARGLRAEDVFEWMLDPALSEYCKYQAMYYYRDHFCPDTLRLYALLLSKHNFARTSALLRHEVNFILGQLEQKAKTEEMRRALIETVENEEEEPVVRHEAVLAYSAVFGNDEVVQRQLSSPVPLVRESACIVFS